MSEARKREIRSFGAILRLLPLTSILTYLSLALAIVSARGNYLTDWCFPNFGGYPCPSTGTS